MKNKKNKVLKVLLGVVGAFVLFIAVLIGFGFLTIEYVNEDKPIEKTVSKNNMNDFDAKTLNGANFTNEDLKKYDLTMVNIWYTGCKPCVDKMPDTQDLYTKLPKNVNLISICADGNENTELAKKIITDSNVKYPALIPDDKLVESLIKNVSVFPTTIFVDKDGNIVGQPIQGAPATDYTKMYLEEINRRLELLKK